LPLITGDGCRAPLFFMATATGAYTHLHRALLEQIASAVAVALDDCLAHRDSRRRCTARGATIPLSRLPAHCTSVIERHRIGRILASIRATAQARRRSGGTPRAAQSKTNPRK